MGVGWMGGSGWVGVYSKTSLILTFLGQSKYMYLD